MPIVMTEIEAYLKIAGISHPATKLKYMRLIKRMDAVELKHIHSKQTGGK